MTITNRQRLTARMRGPHAAQPINTAVDARTHYRSGPATIRELVARTGLAEAAVAARLGISPRTLYAYTAIGGDPAHRRTAPYTVQVALEALALWPG